MTEQVIALEIIRCKDVVEGVSEICQFFKLSVKIFLEKLDGWFVVQLISLEEVKEITLFLEELELAVGLFQLFVFLFRKKVGNGIMKIWSGKLLGHASTLYNIYHLFIIPYHICIRFKVKAKNEYC